MTRMTKQINLALLSAALTASGCGQNAAPQPVAQQAQPVEWGDNPPPAAEEDWGQDEETARANHAARTRHATHLFIFGGAIHSVVPGPAPIRRTSTGVRPGSMGTTILPGHTSGTSTSSKSSTSSVSRGGFGSTGTAISGGGGS